MWARPTCDVNGMVSGYGGEGAKTIIPAKAMAKVSMRLVPEPGSRADRRGVRRATCSRSAPRGRQVEVDEPAQREPGARAARLGDDAGRACGRCAQGFGAEPVFIREGGSIPIVGTFQSCLKAPVLLLGYGLSTDNIHSPQREVPCGELLARRPGRRPMLLQEAPAAETPAPDRRAIRGRFDLAGQSR